MGDVMHFPLVIIGGGPGGLAAAATVGEFGIRTLVVDEAETVGGQAYRGYPVEFEVSGRLSQRKEYRERQILVDTVSKYSCIEKWHNALFWGVDEEGVLLIAQNQKLVRVGYDALIVATGAYDRSVPFPGWTLPGVFSTGGAFRLVKTQRILPGRHVVLAGTGPLLLVMAEALLHAGVKILAFVDSASTTIDLQHVPALLNIPSLCIEALRLKWQLFKSRTPVYQGWGIVEARGKDRISKIVCAPFNPQGSLDESQKEVFETDAMIVGYGLLSRTEVARLLGCEMYYDHTVRDSLPDRNDIFETSVENVFAIGDGARVAGRFVAREEGKIAALAIAEKMGMINTSLLNVKIASCRARLKRLYRFRQAVDELCALPKGLYAVPDDDTIICRCEEITAGQIRSVLPAGKIDLNDIKRRIRPGSGWCQGRTCGPITVEMLARHLSLSPEEIFRMNQRPPSKPIPLSMLTGEN